MTVSTNPLVSTDGLVPILLYSGFVRKRSEPDGSHEQLDTDRIDYETHFKYHLLENLHQIKNLKNEIAAIGKETGKPESEDISQETYAEVNEAVVTELERQLAELKSKHVDMQTRTKKVWLDSGRVSEESSLGQEILKDIEPLTEE